MDCFRTEPAKYLVWVHPICCITGSYFIKQIIVAIKITWMQNCQTFKKVIIQSSVSGQQPNTAEEAGREDDTNEQPKMCVKLKGRCPETF